MKFTIGEKARVGAVLVGSNNKCVAEPTSQPCQEGAPTSSRPSSTSHGTVGVVSRRTPISLHYFSLSLHTTHHWATNYLGFIDQTCSRSFDQIYSRK